MYIYEIRYKDNTTEFVEATDVQNACCAAGCTIEEVCSVIVKYDIKAESKDDC